MTTALHLPSIAPQGAPGQRTVAQPRLQIDVILQILACDLPLMLGFLAGQPILAGNFFLCLLLGFLAYHAARKQPFQFLSVLCACVPVLTLIRGTLIFFNIITALLACGLAWAWFDRKMFSEFWRKKPLHLFIAATVVYWFITFMLTGRYSGNIRALEWSFSAGVVILLSERRSFLSTALLGIGISVIAVGIGLMPYGDRLGMGDVEGVEMGNPIQLGLSGALVFLLSVAERGRWLLLQKRPFWRVVIGVACGTLCVMSTSRGSWLVVVTAILVLVLLDAKARLPVLVSLAVLGVVGNVLLDSSRGQNVQKYLNKIINPDSSIESKTGGRSDQWKAFPELFSDSPIWGFGPGSGVDVSRHYAHRKIPFHSLYLHFGAETGIIGLILLALFLKELIGKGITQRRVHHEVVPLMATLGFTVLGLSVIGMDSLGGMWIGLGLVAGNRGNAWVVRRVIVGARREQSSSLADKTLADKTGVGRSVA